jgi:hypothetical protein
MLPHTNHWVGVREARSEPQGHEQKCADYSTSSFGGKESTFRIAVVNLFHSMTHVHFIVGSKTHYFHC